MVQDIMRDVIEDAKRHAHSSGQSVFFSEPGFAGASVSKDAFVQLGVELSDASGEQVNNVVFIDGGNAELFSSPDMCVHFVRVFQSIYSGTKRLSCSFDEFYVIARTEDVGGKLVYSARLFSSASKRLTASFFGQQFRFDPFDRQLTGSASRLGVSSIPSVIRRIAELSTALLVLSDVGQEGVVVIDGDLSSRSADESKLLEAIAKLSRESGVFVCGLSKTSEVLASGGESVVSIIRRLAPGGAWLCPAASSQVTKTFFVRLHASSEYVFRLDAFVHVTNVAKYLSPLVSHSKDPVFLGYPYGLIEADRFARVSNREAESLRMMFRVKAGKDWGMLDSAAKAMDAHSVLDRVA